MLVRAPADQLAAGRARERVLGAARDLDHKVVVAVHVAVPYDTSGVPK